MRSDEIFDQLCGIAPSHNIRGSDYTDAHSYTAAISGSIPLPSPPSGARLTDMSIDFGTNLTKVCLNSSHVNL